MMIAAPASRRNWMVGIEALILPSSVIKNCALSSLEIGTFKSQRRKTRLPLTTSGLSSENNFYRDFPIKVIKSTKRFE